MREEDMKGRTNEWKRGRKDEWAKGSNNTLIATPYALICRSAECRDGARTVSTSARNQRNQRNHINQSSKFKVEMENVLKINAGIACSDKANEVEPRPNKDEISVEHWNDLLILTCHPYGILLTANIFSTNISSLRDLLSATTENTDGAITSALSKSRRDDTLLTVCFSLRWTNDVSDYVIVKGDGADWTVSCVSSFSIFNFQLAKAEEAEKPQPKSRHKLPRILTVIPHGLPPLLRHGR